MAALVETDESSNEIRQELQCLLSTRSSYRGVRFRVSEESVQEWAHVQVDGQTLTLVFVKSTKTCRYQGKLVQQRCLIAVSFPPCGPNAEPIKSPQILPEFVQTSVRFAPLSLVNYATQIPSIPCSAGQNYNLQMIASGYFEINASPTYQPVLENFCMDDCLLHQSSFNKRSHFLAAALPCFSVWKEYDPIPPLIVHSLDVSGSQTQSC